jgi:outer membrane protein OmpA-like peptidoglycan-associated protein
MRSGALALWAVLAVCRVAYAQAATADSSSAPAAHADRSPAQSSTASAVVVREEVVRESEVHTPSTLGLSIEDPRTSRQAPGAVGSIGTLHVLSADLGSSGLLRFSALGEYFNASDFPVRTASDTRSAGTFALSYVLLDYLELYANYSASANSNSDSAPSMISSLGDFGVGAKAAARLARAFYAGVDTRFYSYASAGDHTLRGSAVGFAPQLIATYDIHEAVPMLPLRLHGNFGALLDNTRRVVASQPLNAAEQFALSVNEYDRLTLGIAAEVPLPALTPFAEYNLRFPLGVPRGVLVGPDGALVPLGRALPHAVTLGAKLTAIRALTLTAAVDLGLSRLVGLGVPAIPPYNFLFGAAFAVDPFSSSQTRIIEKVESGPPREQPKTGKIAGVVLDAQSKKPIAGAVVAMVGAGVPPVASDAESGAFLSHELPAGPVKLEVKKDGYRPAEQELVLRAGRTSRAEIALEPIARKARFSISVTSNKQPIVASVSLKGPEYLQVPFSTASAAVKVEAIPGKYLVNVTSPSHLAQTREVEVPEGSEMALGFDLAPKPKRTLVKVRENKIEILQQVHFAPGKSTILADSSPLLAQVVDAIINSGITRLRIEGHTDNRGNPKFNMQLSGRRARAVAEYLERAGIERNRLETTGFGDSRPIAPNLTARGRELNRRVELIILER